MSPVRYLGQLPMPAPWACTDCLFCICRSFGRNSGHWEFWGSRLLVSLFPPFFKPSQLLWAHPFQLLAMCLWWDIHFLQKLPAFYELFHNFCYSSLPQSPCSTPGWVQNTSYHLKALFRSGFSSYTQLKCVCTSLLWSSYSGFEEQELEIKVS